MAANQGYRTQQKLGQPQYQTYQQVGRAGGGSYAADTVQKVLFDTTPLNDQVEAGSTTTVLVATAHTALPGDMIRFASTSANPYIEVAVLSVDTNTISLAGALPATPIATDEFKVMRWITPQADSSGNMIFSPGPLTYVRDSVNTQVEEDTGNTANNRGFPILPMFYKDGNMVSVNVDTVTPANNRLFPVELSSLAGPITVNAGDLSVSIVSTNDSVAIGDGATGLLANVTTNGTTNLEELHVTDDDAIALLTTIDQDTSDIAATLGTAGSPIASDGVHVLGSDGANARFLKTDAAGELQIDVLSSALPTGASTLAEQQSQTTVLGDIRTAVQLIDNSANVDGTPIGTAGLAIGGRDGSGDFQQVSVNAAGELSVTFGSAGFATETTLSALNNKVANNYGAATGAIRTASQIGNTGGAADFNAGATGAQTLRVAANLMREGNALAYNVGTANANTLRTASLVTDGTSVLPFGTLGAAQFTAASIASLLPALATMLGWDGTTHRELAVNTAGALRTVSGTGAAQADGGSISNATQGASATTVTAPANAIGFMITADANNTDNLYWAVGATASATSGQGLEPGRDTGFVPCGANISIFGAASTPRYNIQWFTRS